MPSRQHVADLNFASIDKGGSTKAGGKTEYFWNPLNQIINSVMETAIPYYVTIRMIRINNYAVTTPRGLFEIFPVFLKGVYTSRRKN